MLSVEPGLLMETADGKAYEGWANVKWDPFKGPETLLGREIPKNYVQEMPFERLEPAKS